MIAVAVTSLVSAAGCGRDAALHAVRAERSALIPCDFGGVAHGYIGRVAGVERHALPQALAAFDCRNHRLADMALHADGFLAAVAAARARHGADRIATVLGTSTSGVLACEEGYAARDADGALPAAFDYAHTHDLAALAEFVRRALGLQGPAFTVSLACASAARAFIDAAHLIEAGVADAAVVGGADSLCRLTLRGFASLELVSPDPCAPCDARRAGVSIGEAAGFALLERAPPGTPGFALLGFGASSDGYHMSSPLPGGEGAAAAMHAALDRAGLSPADVDAVNLHGTGTRANDAAEDAAMVAVFGDAVPCSSTKGITGHCMGSAGIVEAVLALACAEAGVLPGCTGTTAIDPAFGAQLNLRTRALAQRVVMSNSFGFGGANVSLVFGRG